VVLLVVPNFLQRYVQLAPGGIRLDRDFGVFTSMVTMPFMAAACDRFGRKPVMLTGIGPTAPSAVPMFNELDPRAFYGATFVAQIVLGDPVGDDLSPVPASLAELFPARARLVGQCRSATTCPRRSLAARPRRSRQCG